MARRRMWYISFLESYFVTESVNSLFVTTVLAELKKLNEFKTIHYATYFYYGLIPFYILIFILCLILNKWLGRDTQIRTALESSSYYDVFIKSDYNFDKEVSETNKN